MRDPSRENARVPPHLDPESALRFVEGLALRPSLIEHLRGGCEPCHTRIQVAFDSILIALDAGRDTRDPRDWLACLGERFTQRHCCPADVAARHGAREERALRHVRHCPLCATDLQELGDLARTFQRSRAPRRD